MYEFEQVNCELTNPPTHTFGKARRVRANLAWRTAIDFSGEAFRHMRCQRLAIHPITRGAARPVLCGSGCSRQRLHQPSPSRLVKSRQQNASLQLDGCFPERAAYSRLVRHSSRMRRRSTIRHRNWLCHRGWPHQHGRLQHRGSCSYSIYHFGPSAVDG